MNIAIIGYGKMGKMIEQQAIQRGHNVAAIFDPRFDKPLTIDSLKDIDVAIEFSSPETATENYLKCIEAKIPVVSGTTGWLKDWQYIVDETKKHNSAFFYASNFSLGVNLFFQLNETLAKKMAEFQEYKPSVQEIHHTQKLDAPSGTAITLAEKILDYNTRLESWILNTVGSNEDLPIFALREGAVPGTHMVNYISEIDKITIKHEAFGRHGFVLGAVRAAEFINGKKGVYSMKDLLAE